MGQASDLESRFAAAGIAQRRGRRLCVLPPSAICIALWLCACAGDGGGHSKAETAQDDDSAGPVAPAAPTGVTATVGDTEVTISWYTVTGADSYNLYWANQPGVSKNANRLVNVTSPFPHTGLQNGTPHFYVVTALNAAGESPESAEAGATPQVPAPGAPTGVGATAGDGEVTVFWDSVTGAGGYNLYWSTSPGVTTGSTKITGVGSPYAHTGRVNGTPYYYRLTAETAGGESALSPEVSATPQAVVTPPISAPTGLSATALDGRVRLLWNSVSGADSYKVYRSTTSGIRGARIADPTPASYEDRAVNNGTPYFYMVTAVSAGLESSASEEASATPRSSWTILAPLPTPRELATSSAVGSVIYVIGGIEVIDGAPGGQVGTVEAYDTGSGTWSTKAPMTTPRHAPMSAVIEGKIYVMGGHNGTANVTTVEIYDPELDEWTTGTPMISARTAGVAAVVDGIIYLIGGRDPSNTKNTDSVESYNPATGERLSKAPLPFPRYAMAGGVIGRKIYVAGGDQGGQLADLVVYDPDLGSLGSWTTASAMPTAREFPAGAVVNGRLYVFGDRVSPTEPLATNEAYDSLLGTWEVKRGMPSARDRATASVVDGIIYVFGGGGAPAAAEAAEAYDPSLD